MLFEKDNCINNFDFYAEGKKDFYKKFKEKSILVQGKHKESTPLVTIVLTTYKRPGLLKQALDSALNQKGFEDYQVLVVDNEGEDINIQTETAKLLTQYKDNDKVIYYRHIKSIDFKMDYAFRLARSKWICSLHDDDLLVENHLINMVSIVNKYPEIHYLACKDKEFSNNISMEKLHTLTKAKHGTYKVVKYPACVGHYAGWHGALIERKYYIAIGGMPTNSDGNGDVEMVYKFMYRYGIYELDTVCPLYFYRKWKGQLSMKYADQRLKINQNLYNFYRYNNRRYHKFFLFFWDNISAYFCINACKAVSDEYGIKLDLNEFVKKCKMYSRILTNKKCQEIHFKILKIYLHKNRRKIIQDTTKIIFNDKDLII